jgi:glycosyltransferase involved in cell wall biosynthesis
VNIWLPTIRGGSGSDVYTELLAGALRKRGHNAEITWFNTYFQFAPLLLGSIGPPPNTQIIHTNCYSGLAFRRPDIPLVLTEHLCVSDAESRPFKSLAQHAYHQLLVRQYTRASLRYADGVIAVSAYTASCLKRGFGVDAAQVIHNWVDTERFKPAPVSPREDGRFKLLFVGNMTRRKGADLLEPVMRELGPGFELRCATGLRATLSDSTADNIISLGALHGDSLVHAYQECDALLFPTRMEGLPYAALEAMACGKAVIASNNSGLPEVVEHGVSGLLCPTGDVAAFVGACRRLSADRALCRDYGAAARRRIEANFSEAAIVPRYERFYEKCAVNHLQGAV